MATRGHDIDMWLLRNRPIRWLRWFPQPGFEAPPSLPRRTITGARTAPPTVTEPSDVGIPAQRGCVGIVLVAISWSAATVRAHRRPVSRSALLREVQ